MRTLLTNATLIDCVQPRAVADTTVVIEDGRIREIRTDGSTPELGGGRSIDLRGNYLMPGLWDVHIHPDYYLPTEMPLADQVALFGHRLISALTESGITGFRCAGAHHYMDVAWKRAFDSGQPPRSLIWHRKDERIARDRRECEQFPRPEFIFTHVRAWSFIEFLDFQWARYWFPSRRTGSTAAAGI